MKLLLQGLVLILSFGGIFIWEQTSLADLSVDALAFLVLIYLIVSFYRKRKHIDMFKTNGTIDIFILNCAIILLIFSTGALYSPVYFLIYFLAFGITFIFEPAMVFVFAIGSILIFLPEALKNDSLESFIKLGSILIICPLAFFFGQSYKDREKEEADLQSMAERSKDAADTIATDVESIIKKQKSNLAEKDIEKINDILERTEDLREEIK